MCVQRHVYFAHNAIRTANVCSSGSIVTLPIRQWERWIQPILLWCHFRGITELTHVVEHSIGIALSNCSFPIPSNSWHFQSPCSVSHGVIWKVTSSPSRAPQLWCRVTQCFGAERWDCGRDGWPWMQPYRRLPGLGHALMCVKYWPDSIGMDRIVSKQSKLAEASHSLLVAAANGAL